MRTPGNPPHIQDDITGDGTTSNVILIGEMLKQAERRIDEGLHPRILTDGFDIAKAHALDVLEKCKIVGGIDRAMLLKVAHTSLRTKVHTALADLLTEIVTDAVLAIAAGKDKKDIDLHMVEIMMMQVRTNLEPCPGNPIRGVVSANRLPLAQALAL